MLNLVSRTSSEMTVTTHIIWSILDNSIHDSINEVSVCKDHFFKKDQQTFGFWVDSTSTDKCLALGP